MLCLYVQSVLQSRTMCDQKSVQNCEFYFGTASDQWSDRCRNGTVSNFSLVTCPIRTCTVSRSLIKTVLGYHKSPVPCLIRSQIEIVSDQNFSPVLWFITTFSLVPYHVQSVSYYSMPDLAICFVNTTVLCHQACSDSCRNMTLLNLPTPLIWNFQISSFSQRLECTDCFGGSAIK